MQRRKTNVQSHSVSNKFFDTSLFEYLTNTACSPGARQKLFFSQQKVKNEKKIKKYFYFKLQIFFKYLLNLSLNLNFTISLVPFFKLLPNFVSDCIYAFDC